MLGNTFIKSDMANSWLKVRYIDFRHSVTLRCNADNLSTEHSTIILVEEEKEI